MRKEIAVVVLLLMFSLFLNSSPAAASRTWIYWGQLGNNLNLRIEFETEPKVGIDTEINLTFYTNDVYDVYVNATFLSINGAGIVFPGPTVAYDEIVTRNMSISHGSSFNAIYSVKPTEDGLINGIVRAVYTAFKWGSLTDKVNEWVQIIVRLGYARTVTVTELWSLLWIFVATTGLLVTAGVLSIYSKRKGAGDRAQKMGLSASRFPAQACTMESYIHE